MADQIINGGKMYRHKGKHLKTAFTETKNAECNKCEPTRIPSLGLTVKREPTRIPSLAITVK